MAETQGKKRKMAGRRGEGDFNKTDPSSNWPPIKPKQNLQVNLLKGNDLFTVRVLFSLKILNLFRFLFCSSSLVFSSMHQFLPYLSAVSFWVNFYNGNRYDKSFIDANLQSFWSYPHQIFILWIYNPRNFILYRCLNYVSL